MKFSLCLTALSVSLALVTTGCRYDKAAGEGGDADALAHRTGLNGEYDENDEGGSLNGLLNDGKSFKDRGYKVCTDVSFEPVYFGFDAHSLQASELPKVEAVAQHLASHPERVVSIEGNCDERGSNEYNLSLGDDRAHVIANYLEQNGISSARLETVSRGETNPAVSGSGEAVWSQNRRGEFVIMQK